MPTDALAIAPVILACVLVVSAVGKLRSRSTSAGAFRDLRVPAPLSGRLVVELLPYVELVLAVGLVVVGGPAGTLVAVAALLLFAAYLLLVTRALGFHEDVDCACFGAFAPGRITRRTILRNVWLVVLAAGGVGASLQGGSVASRVAEGQTPWWWLVGSVAAAATVALVVSPAGGTDRAVPQPYANATDEGDYVRARTPAVPVVLGDGSTATLRTLSAERPQLLVHVSEICGSCVEVIEAVPGWRERLPAVDIRLVVGAAPGASALTSATEPPSVHDPQGLVAETFDMRATPSAVLLGADGLLAGGPVVGSHAVPELVADIVRELAELHAH
ncbi:MAG: MauE/DoxX family redox-associated membrane protein [Terrabacter sp.]